MIKDSSDIVLSVAVQYGSKAISLPFLIELKANINTGYQVRSG